MRIGWIILICLTLLACGVVVWQYRRDRRRERARVSELMSRDVAQELDSELAEAREKKRRFEAALLEAKRKVTPRNRSY